MKAELDTIRVLVVDGHTPELRKRVDEIEEIEVVGEASDDEEAVQLVYSLQPDVVFMDMPMPGLGKLARAMCSDST